MVKGAKKETGKEIYYFGRSMMSKVSSREDKEEAREATRIGNFIANGVYRRKPYRCQL